MRGLISSAMQRILISRQGIELKIICSLARFWMSRRGSLPQEKWANEALASLALSLGQRANDDTRQKTNAKRNERTESAGFEKDCASSSRGAEDSGA